MSNSGFVAAALPAIRAHFNSILKYYPGYMEPETINNFLLKNCDKYLTSVGFGIKPDLPIDKRVFGRYGKQFHNMRSRPYLKGCELMLDSAGYSFQVGQIPKEKTEEWVNLYHDFVTENIQYLSNAFLFDPVPGANKSIIESYDEMEKLNVMSYTKAANLQDEVRNKMMYIHHFRTPQINKLFKKLLFEYELGDYFNSFATGGLVSFSKGCQGRPPCNMYIIPLTAIILHAKKRGLKKFRFHVLGDSDFKSVLFHKFVERHVKEIHDIEIEITFDSTAIMKTFMLGRYLYVPMYETKSIHKMYIRKDDLHMNWKDRGTVENYFYELSNNIADDYNFKKIGPINEPIYENGRLTRILYAYGLCVMLQLYRLCENWCNDVVNDLYPLYKDGQTLNFDREIELNMQRINDGKLSRKLYSRSSAVYKSLEMLEKLDIDYCDYLIDRYLSKDEAESLSGSAKLTYF
jgi:hypothetical protein